jgi:hypothetical protein
MEFVLLSSRDKALLGEWIYKPSTYDGHSTSMHDVGDGDSLQNSGVLLNSDKTYHVQGFNCILLLCFTEIRDGS